MAEREDPKNFQLGKASAPAGALVRKLPAARRLLVATIGAATVQFAIRMRRNLRGQPDGGARCPESGQGGRGGPGGQGGRAGQGGQGGGRQRRILRLEPDGAAVRSTSSGTGGPRGGSGGTGGAAPPDMDAGADDDAGQA